MSVFLRLLHDISPELSAALKHPDWRVQERALAEHGLISYRVADFTDEDALKELWRVDRMSGPEWFWLDEQEQYANRPIPPDPHRISYQPLSEDEPDYKRLAAGWQTGRIDTLFFVRYVADIPPEGIRYRDWMDPSTWTKREDLRSEVLNLLTGASRPIFGVVVQEPGASYSRLIVRRPHYRWKTGLLEIWDITEGTEAGPDVHRREHRLLHRAAAIGSASIVRELLARGDAERYPGRAGRALYLAARAGNVEIVRMLVEHSVLQDYLSPVLWDVVGYGHLEVVKVLIEAGADPNAEERLDANNPSEKTAMHHAAEEGQLEIIQCLVDHGGDVNRQNSWGWVPLDQALHMWSGSPRETELDVVCELLLNLGAAASTAREDVIDRYEKLRREKGVTKWQIRRLTRAG